MGSALRQISLQCGRVAEDAESDLPLWVDRFQVLLQCGRVAEDAESRLTRKTSCARSSSFNVAASLRTRNLEMKKRDDQIALLLQCGRVAEDAES